jgi:hypothetical protein
MLIGPKGGSCGTAVYRRQPVYAAMFSKILFGIIIVTGSCRLKFVQYGRGHCLRAKMRSWGKSSTFPSLLQAANLFLFAAAFVGKGLTGITVLTFLGLASFVDCGRTKAVLASAKKSNSPSRGMPQCPAKASRRANSVSLSSVRISTVDSRTSAAVRCSFLLSPAMSSACSSNSGLDSRQQGANLLKLLCQLRLGTPPGSRIRRAYSGGILRLYGDA